MIVENFTLLTSATGNTFSEDRRNPLLDYLLNIYASVYEDILMH